jgi:predicted small secreted protein
MKRTLQLLAIVASTSVVFAACTNETQETTQDAQATAPLAVAEPENTAASQDTIKGSIPSEATGKIGEANLKLTYHAPGVKGRTIWGGLVAYDQVWVTGAHMATTLETDKALVIGGKEIPAGKYALFTIPGREEWTVIINKNFKQHLADNYDQQDDLVRVQVKPTALEQHQERLKYDIISNSSSQGTIKIFWDKLGIEVPVKPAS